MTARSAADVLQGLVPSPDSPGCAAAVCVQGSVVREAGRGKADLTTGRAITPKTVFDMASNSKQCTADLDNPPVWTRDITLGDMMRHTSGISDYQDLLEAKGIKVTDPAGQQEAIADLESRDGKLMSLFLLPSEQQEVSAHRGRILVHRAAHCVR
ncbi:serine hydrolase [Streptomyces sp. NPDC048257]|uniref:serine hydrolase n=1 Tax=Streptomyces sp. NPDC048257 TaxID=3365526 RepID=UPI0037245F0D